MRQISTKERSNQMEPSNVLIVTMLMCLVMYTWS